MGRTGAALDVADGLGQGETPVRGDGPIRALPRHTVTDFASDTEEFDLSPGGTLDVATRSIISDHT
jgi:hypothetical protein